MGLTVPENGPPRPTVRPQHNTFSVISVRVGGRRTLARRASTMKRLAGSVSGIEFARAGFGKAVENRHPGKSESAKDEIVRLVLHESRVVRVYGA